MIRRRGLDTIDFTLLQKKGLLKTKESSSKSEILDLRQNKTNFNSLADSNENISNNLNDQSSNPLASFFGENSSTDIFSSLTPSTSFSESENLELKDLKARYETLEYKFDRLTEKIDFLEEKLKDSNKPY